MDRNTLREELVAAGREMDRLNAELWDSDGLERWLAHVLSAHSVLITAPINMIDDARRIVVQQKRDDDTT